MSSNIVIVYHSGYGHTQKVAQAVADGSGGQLLPIDGEGNLPEGGWEALDKARAIVFGSPTYMGNVSWQFKKFADQSSKVWASQGWKNKLGAAFTNSASVNGDKQTTLYTLFTLAQQHGMLWVGTGLMPSNSKVAKRNDINYLSSFAGLATASPSDASADEVPQGDLDTAKLFGERVAAAAGRIA
ncbi:flavodoxin family protein [Paraburkholderia sp. MMS20-SJTN17]|uniref:Flavoprotein WrbA n=1 Tax=Paraburkholderia translucens TaxID=2886945 RepID=A0ABS8KJM0_9BURK|nr:flavodoxin family protein [Paraburkholderia sp. MMS20-SJTN17]MCC8404633.1 flavodoxin family protein [Paraburkholderia sp. MMS20-SJTN17]